MNPPESDRLRLRPFTDGDAAFVRDLVNQPSWLETIGDRGVRTEADAVGYIRDRLLARHAEHGFGFWLVERRADGEAEAAPIGLCGLIQRAGLNAPDLGYALHPDAWGRGYAREAARATVAWTRRELGARRLLAIVTPGNARSVRVLEAVGMRYVETVTLPGDDGKGDDTVERFRVEWPAADSA